MNNERINIRMREKIDVGACLDLEVWLCNARSVIIALIFKLMIMRFSLRFVHSVILFSTEIFYSLSMKVIGYYKFTLSVYYK